jgi:threonine dehydrogenase-like Zn-dependent dehydrogenase
MTARAIWFVGPGQVEICPAEMGEGTAVETLFTAISRGTERLVLEGKVPESEHTRMRVPAQEGDFSFPVKYGYCTVGRAIDGPYAGQTIFALHPHQTIFRRPQDMLTLVPKGVPDNRAVLAANMETALNILWDSRASAADRIAIVGAGVVGTLVGYLAARLPGADVTLIDQLTNRSHLATKFGCAFATPSQAPVDCDVVIHTTASAAGLSLSMECAGEEATIVEASWHGSGETAVPLGGSFHSRRLKLISSQVGRLPPERGLRWSYGRRMAKALELLRDPALDILISGETSFEDLPAEYGTILAHPNTMCHRIRYQSK